MIGGICFGAFFLLLRNPATVPGSTEHACLKSSLTALAGGPSLEESSVTMMQILAGCLKRRPRIAWHNVAVWRSF